MPQSQNPFCSHISQRWIIVAMCFLSYFNMVAIQNCLPITITEMVPSKNQNLTVTNFNKTFIKNRRFNWDEETQGLILSSYSWGFFVNTLLGGAIVRKYGARYTMCTGILFVAILTLSTPIVIDWGDSMWFIILRILVGLNEGMIVTSTVSLQAHWIPKDERSWAATLAMTGLGSGSFFSIIASGIILQRSDIGWPAVFYFYGTIQLISALILWRLCYDSPGEHPFISDSEKRYLKEKMENIHTNVPPPPWRYIIRSKPIWAILFFDIGKNWLTILLSSSKPKFIKSMLKVPVETNGYISSAPYICSLIFSCVASKLADTVIARKIVSTGCVRKIGSTMGLVISTALLVIMTYVGTNKIAIILLLIMTSMMHSCNNFGGLVNMLDLTPNYASILQSGIFGIASITSILTPYVVGLLTPGQTITEWRHVFYLLFGICALSNLGFAVLGSGEVQKWNNPNFLKQRECDDKCEVKENNELLLKK